MTAAPINNIDRMMAAGTHYHHDAGYRLPAVVGLSGVGVLDDGQRVAFGEVKAPYGTFAEKAAVNKAHIFPLPDGIDDEMAAVLPNPALSSLTALRSHDFQPGQNVFILGATGVAGMLAVQIAKHLGAGRVVAVGRNESSLEKCRSLGADRIISLRNNLQDVSAAFSNEMSGYPIDVVLDFVWGQPAELLLKTLTGHDLRAVPTARAKYIQIGEMAGAHIQLAAETLRSRAIQLSGSGGGSVPLEYLQKIPEYYQEVLDWAAKGILSIETERVPLRDIEAAWNRPVHGKRLVVTNEP